MVAFCFKMALGPSFGKDLMDIHTNHNSTKNDHSKSVSRTKYCYSNKINESLDLITEMGT